MKKLCAAAVLLLALCLLAGALAEGETVVFTNGRGASIEVDKDAEAINLGSVTLTNQGSDYSDFMEFLKKLPNLKRVDMYSTEIRRAQIEKLAAAFPDMEWGWTMVIPCNNPLHPERTPHKVRTDVTAFSTLHNNQCTPHPTEDLAILRFCKNLLALDIGHNAVDNLSFLYDLPHLKVLIVGRNALNDITPLGSLKELEYLELFSNRVYDISPLANCVSLVDLNICYNYVHDYTPLTGLENLRRLCIYNSNNYSDSDPVPYSVVATLKNALPKCAVDTYTSAASGAWREHHRYDTIYKMFWGTEYIPFDNLD